MNLVVSLCLLFAFAGLAGCVATRPEAPLAQSSNAPVGLNTQPEGPARPILSSSSEGASVRRLNVGDAAALDFLPGGGPHFALLTFDKTDINDRIGLALDVRNRGDHPVRIYADLNGDTWVRGYVSVEPGKTNTLYVFARRKKLSADVVDQFPGMHGVPGGKMSLWAGIEEPIFAEQLKVFVVEPRTAQHVEVGNLRPFGSSRLPEVAPIFPFIDRYGQYKHKEWPGKVHQDADLHSQLEREDAELAANVSPPGLDRYGGWLAGPQLEATGSFRVEKYQGRWWFVDPEGRLFWSNGIDMVGFNHSLTRITDREKFYEDPAPMGNFLGRNLQTKYGENWREIAGDRMIHRVRSWGMNTLGGGVDPAISKKGKVPYTVLLNSGGRGTTIDPDSDAWKERMRRSLAAAAASIKDDPWCIGFFVDNEIHVSGDPVWWEKYYREVSAVVKELIPKKLYLGSRLDYHDWPDVVENRKEIVRIAAKYCDVISFNFYKFTLDYVRLPEGVDRPAIIGEFHFGALDRGLFHTGLRSVIDQNHRAECYRNYVSSALQNPTIIGALWFQCYDESTTGRFDGENYQIGFLDICDSPYSETVAAARDIGYRIYAVRTRSR